MSTVRKELVWSIKNNSYKLSGEKTYQIAIDNETDRHAVDSLDPTDEGGGVDYILFYMQSESLLTSEDGGMSQLLMLNDLVCRIVQFRVPADMLVLPLVI